MNISSISPEIGLALQAGGAAQASDLGTDQRPETRSKKEKPAGTNPIPAAATELVGLSENQSTTGASAKISAPLIVNGLGLGLKFSVDKDTNRQVIEVIDTKTGDVVRQIPPEEVLNFLREFHDAKGLFISRHL